MNRAYVRFMRLAGATLFGLLVACLVGCLEGPYEEAAPEVPAVLVVDALARESLAARSIAVTGRVVLPDATPVPGADVAVGEVRATTDADGRFALEAPRRNAWLTITGAGLRTTRLGAWLARPVSEVAIALGALTVTRDDGSVRFAFAGDTSFARRFLDPFELTDRYSFPPDDPSALVRVSDPGPGSLDAVSRIAPLFAASDFPVLNFESVLTLEPATPHPTKPYCYFTLPASLVALESLGVTFVSIGNNHVYDYLERGLMDTRATLDAAGIGYSGAGRTPDEAFIPWRTEIGGLPFSFVGASSVSGEVHAIRYNASDTQGGAADLNDSDRVRAVIEGERALGRLPIAQLHTGVEYTVEPTDYTRTRLDLAAESGALIVIGHHPHVAQGFSVHAGVLQVHSLGNFTFDQDRHETMLGLVVLADLDSTRERHVVAYPIYLEDYRPRLAVGPIADAVLRRIAQYSDPSVSFALEAGRLLVARTEEATFAPAERSVTVEARMGAEGVGVVDLRDVLAPGESVARLDAAPGASSVRRGSDILVYGTFEDDDVDEDVGEASRYDVTSIYSEPCLRHARRGLQGLCMVRAAGSRDPAVVAFRNRVRVPGDSLQTPNRDLSFVGWVRGEGAGASAVRARYYASEGDAEFGGERIATLPAGTFDWTMVSAPLRVPPDVTTGDDPMANPRALRFFLEHEPPARGEGVLGWDDLAVVAWESELSVGESLRAPNGVGFLQIAGAPGATVTLSLTLRAGR